MFIIPPRASPTPSHRRHRRLTAFSVIAAALALVLVTIGSEIAVSRAAAGRIYVHPAQVRRADVGLVLGTNPTVRDGRRNLFFKHRIEAAAALYHAGTVRHLLVSGDNHTSTYDEPTAMRDALIAAGVPEKSITLDYAGFRTLDSVVRAKVVFGQSKLVIVSQGFHCERAVYIAEAHGIDAVGFIARTPGGAGGGIVRARELLARVAAVLDTTVFGTGPRFDGPHEPISLAARSAP